MRYENHLRNYAIPRGREQALADFLNQTHEGIRHKHQHKHNPNSEDALTWSCFETLASLPFARKLAVLREVFEDAYAGEGKDIFGGGLREGDIAIHAGKTYTGAATGESTELDASIELPGALVFFEAKLYSPLTLETATKRDQIARKLRVGVDAPLGDAREFFFVFLDIAPMDKLLRLKRGGNAPARGFCGKWNSAEYFDRYRNGAGLRPLRDALAGIDAPAAESIAANMGWLTWANLFKSILRGVL